MKLKQTVREHIKKLKNNSTVTLHREEIYHISGLLEINEVPNWRLILKDTSYMPGIPCIIIDRSSFINHISDYNKCHVVIEKSYIVVERHVDHYFSENNTELVDDELNKNKYSIYLQFSPKNVNILKRLGQTAIYRVFPDRWMQPVLVVHVTTPVVILGHSVFCLSLVMLYEEGKIAPEYTWLVLKGSQVAWHDLLVPNKVYMVHMAEDYDYFEIARKPLRAMLGKLRAIKVFKEIVHHPELWPTMNAVELPPKSGISIAPLQNVDVNYLKKFNCTYSPAWWQSINEVLSNNSNKQKIVSLWGEVVRVSHDKTVEKDGCSLCSKQYRFPVNGAAYEVTSPANLKWTDPWENTLSGFSSNDKNLKQSSPIQLPPITETETECNWPDNITNSMFMAEKKLKLVVMKDISSGKTITLYVKNWSSHVYTNVFTPGVVLCAKFLHKRISGKGTTYFVTCALSSFEIISDITSLSNAISQNSIVYGFPYIKVDASTVWGVLDMWQLTRVCLMYKDAKNVNGGALNNHKICSSVTEKVFTATALLKVDRHTDSPVNVILKDDNVRFFLDIPQKVWEDLKLACTRYIQLVYTPRDCELDDGMSDIEKSFYAFCAVKNLKKSRFHVACKLLFQTEGEDDMYFCKSISNAEPEHMFSLSKPKLLSSLLNKSFKNIS